MIDTTTARITAASMPTPESQVAALRAIAHEMQDPWADDDAYYVDRHGVLWFQDVDDDKIRRAHSAPRYGDSEMEFESVQRFYGPLTRVDA